MAATTLSPTCTIAGPKPEKAFNRRFQFVDGLGGNAAVKKTRSHVTREFYREQRYNDMHKTGSKPAPFSRPTPVAKSGFVVQVLEFNETDQQNFPNIDLFHDDSDDDLLGSALAGGLVKGRSTKTKQTRQRPVPVQSCLGAGRRDPFDTLPVRGTYEVAELVDYWYFVIPQFVHKQWRRFFMQPRPCRNLIYVYREDAATFLGLLHYSAQHMATSKGLSETKSTLNYKYKTIHAVNKRIQSRTGPQDDVTILAVTLLANAERIWGDPGVARMHASALRRMILERGGFASFQHHRLLHAKLVWSLIALPASQPFFFTPDTGSCMPCEDGDDPIPSVAVFASFADLIKSRRDAVERLQHCSPEHRASHRFRAFEAGTRLNQALGPATISTLCLVECTDSTSRASKPHQSDQTTLDYMRMACLIYFNLILDACGDLSEKTEVFLSQFSPYPPEPNEDFKLSAEHFLWSLVNLSLVRANARSSQFRCSYPRPHEIDVLDPVLQPEIRKENALVWQLASFMDLLKIQSQGTWNRVEDSLRSFLFVNEEREAVEDYETLFLERLTGCVADGGTYGAIFV